MTVICLYHFSRFSFDTSTSRLGVSVRYPRKESSWSLTVNGSECDASWCSWVVSAAVWIVRANRCDDCHDVSAACLVLLCAELTRRRGTAVRNRARVAMVVEGRGGGGGRIAGGEVEGAKLSKCRQNALGRNRSRPKVTPLTPERARRVAESHDRNCSGYIHISRNAHYQSSLQSQIQNENAHIAIQSAI